MDTKRHIHYILNLEFNQPKFWERIILMFCKLEIMESDLGKVYYKYFLDRLYIYRRDLVQPQRYHQPNYVLETPVTFDGGVNTPWLN